MVDKEALQKSREEREEAYQKAKKVHEAKELRAKEELKREEAEVVDETDVVVEDAYAAPSSQKVSYFDDTNLFWEEAGHHEEATEEVLDPLMADDDNVHDTSLADGDGMGGISLVTLNKGKKKKKPGFRSRKKKVK